VGGGHFGALLLGLVTWVADVTCGDDAKILFSGINMRDLFEKCPMFAKNYLHTAKQCAK
jgi:hypothetical protein